MNWKHLRKSDVWAYGPVVELPDGSQTRQKARIRRGGDVEVWDATVDSEHPVMAFSVEQDGQLRMALDESNDI